MFEAGRDTVIIAAKRLVSLADDEAISQRRVQNNIHTQLASRANFPGQFSRGGRGACLLLFRAPGYSRRSSTATNVISVPVGFS
jgi:hypothetical protein